MANLTPSNIPESARIFFASVSSPTEILFSNLVSRVQVIEGRYNHVHILNFNTGDQGLFSFVLRFPNAISRWKTSTAVGCMLYCQRHPNLNIPTPAIYAYSCTYGSEFIAMEYINGDILSEVWQDLLEEDKENMVCQVAEIMCTMRTKTAFSRIGGIGPDGSACPLVHRIGVASGRGVIDSLGLYNIGPYDSVQEYIQSVLDRQFHYMDQILHKDGLSAYEAEFTENWFSDLTPEGAFESAKSQRDDFIARPYNPEYPFVLRHGDMHGRNVIVSHSSPRRILAILDWDYGGSHALPFADDGFDVYWPDSNELYLRRKQIAEINRIGSLIHQRTGARPHDTQLAKLVFPETLHNILGRGAYLC